MSKNNKVLEEYLNERYEIMMYDTSNTSNRVYYEGLIKALELVGKEWERKDGKHKVY